MRTVAEFKEFAEDVHVDDMWGDYPYSHHLQLVADRAKFFASSLDVDVVSVEKLAWVHDTLEDHPELFESISLLSNFEDIVSISKLRGEDYFDYIDRVITGVSDVVLIVKLADLVVNFCNDPPDRLKERYSKAFLLLFNNFYQRFKSNVGFGSVVSDLDDCSVLSILLAELGF